MALQDNMTGRNKGFTQTSPACAHNYAFKAPLFLYPNSYPDFSLIIIDKQEWELRVQS